MALSKRALRYTVSKDGCWDVYMNPDVRHRLVWYEDPVTHVRTRGLYDPFKMHISIAPEYFDAVIGSLTEILKEAAFSLAITGYKIFKQRNDASNHPANTHWPITLYLPERYSPQNADKAIALCNQIHAVLRAEEVPEGDYRHLCVCDLPVSNHISFRCSTIDLNAADDDLRYYSADGPEGLLLKQVGEECDYYKDFTAAFHSEMKQVSDDEVVPVFVTSTRSVPSSQIMHSVSLAKHVADGKSPLSAKNVMHNNFMQQSAPPEEKCIQSSSCVVM